MYDPVSTVAIVIESRWWAFLLGAFKEDALASRYSHGSRFSVTELRDLHWSLVSIVYQHLALAKWMNQGTSLEVGTKSAKNKK